jgi:hypothetical protein
MSIKKVITEALARIAPPATEEDLFNTIAKNAEESFMITVKEGGLKVYVARASDVKSSRLAGALSKIAGDVLSLGTVKHA